MMPRLLIFFYPTIISDPIKFSAARTLISSRKNIPKIIEKPKGVNLKTVKQDYRVLDGKTPTTYEQL